MCVVPSHRGSPPPDAARTPSTTTHPCAPPSPSRTTRSAVHTCERISSDESERTSPIVPVLQKAHAREQPTKPGGKWVSLNGNIKEMEYLSAGYDSRGGRFVPWRALLRS